MSSEVQAKWMNSETLHHFGVALGVLLDPVFERLDVVVGDGSSISHLGGLLRLEVGDQRIERSDRCRRKGGQSPRKCGSAASAFSHSISTLQATTDQAVFGELLAASASTFDGIAPIEQEKAL